jgi:hypothetical protein
METPTRQRLKLHFPCIKKRTKNVNFVICGQKYKEKISKKVKIFDFKSFFGDSAEITNLDHQLAPHIVQFHLVAAGSQSLKFIYQS